MSVDVEQIATSRFDEQLCVVAVAGSGKTRLLTERFLAAVRSGAVEMGQILALTFTEKAATEMRERIVGAFAQRGEYERAQAAYGASISTIHAFCARLLREYALEAGLPPRFAVLDEGEGVLLFRECWDYASSAPDFLPLEEGYAWRNLDAESVYGAVSGLHAQARTYGWGPDFLRKIVAADAEALVAKWQGEAGQVVREAAEKCGPGGALLEPHRLWSGKGRETNIERRRAELIEALREAGGDTVDPAKPLRRAL